MTGFAYEVDEDLPPTLGLIVLQTDETIEDDFRALFGSAVRLHVSRVRMGDDLTEDVIAAMKRDLPRAVSLLPQAARFACVGYACTSGTAVIGARQVEACLREGANTRSVSDPHSAALAAARALGIGRLGIVSPYLPPIAEQLTAAFEAGGQEIGATLSFGELAEARVARIAPASIREAARELALRGGIDGMFLSCTNLRTLSVIDTLEAELGLPVLSSNQVLAWHMARSAGVLGHVTGVGRLFST